MPFITVDRLITGDKVTIGLINYGVASTQQTFKICLEAITKHYLFLNEETALSLQRFISSYQGKVDQQLVVGLLTILNNKDTVKKNPKLIKAMISKLDGVEDLHNLMASLFSQPQDPLYLEKLIYLSHLIKSTKNADFIAQSPIWKGIISSPANTREMEAALGKCIFFLDLKLAAPEYSLQHSASPILNLYKAMSLIVRGNQKGYSALKDMIASEKDPSFSSYFGKIVAKQRDDYLTKENGFHVFKLYKQRLFSTLYPVLLELVNKMDTATEE